MGSSPMNLSVTPGGFFFVSGTTGDTAIFDNDTIFNMGYFISKYDNYGNEIWVRSIAFQSQSNYSSSHNESYLTIDHANNIYLAGSILAIS